MIEKQCGRELYLGEAIGTIAGGQQEVQLTKFNTLSLENQTAAIRQDADANEKREGLAVIDLMEEDEDKKSKSNNNLALNDKWPWVSSSSIKSSFSADDLMSASAGLNKNLSLQKEAARKQEPFEVVWRKLSFEVKVSTYNQLIDKAMRGLRSLWPHKGQTKVEKKLAHDAESDRFTFSYQQNATSVPKKRVILKNLNGFIKSGEITAILGPSGSGKTSLLNAICGRVDNYRGSVQLIGGGKRRMRLSIIPQKDYLIDNLSVRENLLYSSRILNTGKDFDHESNIMRVLRMLNLTSCFESCVSNISGGEYKRVSIAQELLRQPDILILDEPTSGLDSLNCKKLVQSLAKLIEESRKGSINPIAIVMSIHQPDVDIFHMFDHIYCMARGGRVIFDGRPSEVMGVLLEQISLSNQQLSVETSQSFNPANLLIEIASEDAYGRVLIEQLSRLQLNQFESTYASPQSIRANQEDTNMLYDKASNFPATIPHKMSISMISLPGSNLSFRSSYNSNPNAKECQLVRDKKLTPKREHKGHFWHHTNILARRAFTSTIRDPLMTIISLIFHLTIPFVMYTVYSKDVGTVKACPMIQRDLDMISMASNNTIGQIEELQEQLSLALECCTMFFLSTYSFSMCSLSVAALAFPLNMHILLKEVRNGWYGLPSYVIAKTIANFPFEVLFPTISVIMIYLMMGMPGSYYEWRIWAIALVMGLISIISHTQGLIFGALCMDSVQTAIFLASSATLPQTLLSGFTARIKHMPIVLQKLSWFSLYRYSSDSINIIRFGFDNCPCDESTDEYLRTKQASFTDIPQNMKPLFTYYLTNTAPGPTLTLDNSTLITSNVTNLVSEVSTNLTNMNLIPGLSHSLTLNPIARAELIQKIDANEIDLFGQMADLMARSFTYGRSMDSCDSVRSQLLATAGAPKDQYLPLLFAGMFALMIATKLILFVIVKTKIGSRI